MPNDICNNIRPNEIPKIHSIHNKITFHPCNLSTIQLIIMKKRKTIKPKEKQFELPTARVIKIDTSVSLLLTSLPPGNPSMPGFNPPDWGRPKWG